MAKTTEYVVKLRHVIKQEVDRDKVAEARAKKTVEDLSKQNKEAQRQMYMDSANRINDVVKLHTLATDKTMADIGKLTSYRKAQSALWATAEEQAYGRATSALRIYNTEKNISLSANRTTSKTTSSKGYGSFSSGGEPSAAPQTPSGYSNIGGMTRNLSKYTIAMNNANKATVKTRSAIQKLGLGAKVASNNVKKLSTSIQTSTTDAHSLLNTMKRAAVTVPAFYAVAAGFMAISTAIGDAFTRAAEFDLATRTLAAVLSNQTLSSTRAAAMEFNSLSTVIGGAVADYEKAALLLARSGIGDIMIDDLTKAVGITSRLSLITGENLELAASAVITFKQAYSKGNDGLQAYGGSIKEIGDKIAFMANASKLSLQDIGTFSNYAVAAGKAAGLTQDSLNGMAIAFSNAGNKASTIGTQIRRFTATLTSSREGVVKFYKAIGVNRQQLNSDLQKSKSGAKKDKKESNDAFNEFVLKIASLDQIMYNTATAGMAILDKQFFDNVRNNSDEIVNNVETSFSKIDGALDKTGIMADSLSKRWESMGNSILTSTTPFAESLSEFTTSFTEFLYNVGAVGTNAIVSFAQFDSKELDAAIKSLVTGSSVTKLRAEYEELNATMRTGSKEQKAEARIELNLLNNKIMMYKEYDRLQNRNAEADNVTKKMKLEENVARYKLIIYGLEEGSTVFAQARLNIDTALLEKIKEENAEKVKGDALERRAIVRAKKLADFSKLDEQQRSAAVSAVKKLIRAEQALRALKPVEKADIDAAKSYSSIVSAARGLALMDSLTKQNTESLEQYHAALRDVKTAEVDRAAAMDILKLAEGGDASGAAEKMFELRRKLTKDNTQEAKNLLTVLDDIDKVNASTLAVQAERTSIVTKEFNRLTKIERTTRAIQSLHISMKATLLDTSVITGNMTKEEAKLAVAKNRSKIATDTMLVSNKTMNNVASKYNEGKVELKTLEEAIANYMKDSVANNKALNDVLSITITQTAKVAANVLKSANAAIDFKVAMGQALDAYNKASRASDVTNGKIVTYAKVTGDYADAYIASSNRILAIKKKQKNIADALAVTGDKAIKGEEARKAKVAEGLNLSKEIIAEHTKLVTIKDSIHKATIDNNVKIITQEGELNELSIRRSNLASEVVGKKVRKLQQNEEELKQLKVALDTTKKIYAAVKGGDDTKEYAARIAYENAYIALLAKRKDIQNNKRDIADAPDSKGAADARAKQKALADEISLLSIKAELANSEYRLQTAMDGRNLDGYALELRKLEVYRLQSVELQNAAEHAASKSKIDKKNIIAEKRAIKAQTKANNATSKFYEKRNKLLKDSQDEAVDGWLNVASGISSTLGLPFDNLIDGVKNFYGSLRAMQDAYFAYNEAQKAIAAGTASKTAIAQAGAQGGIYGAAIMMAILAAVGLGSTIAGMGGSTAVAPTHDTYQFESDSLENIMSSILDVQYPLLEYTKSMDSHLAIIQNAFGGLESALVSSGFIINDKYAGDERNKTVESTGSYLTLGDVKVGELLDEYNAVIDNEFKVTTRRWTGRTNVSYENQYQQLGEDIGEFVQEVVNESVYSLVEAGAKLSVDTSVLDNFTMSFKEIDVSGMDSSGVVGAITSATSSELDVLAKDLFGEVLDGYRESISGYYEKAVAITVDFDQLTQGLGLIGESLQNVTVDSANTPTWVQDLWRETYGEAFSEITTYAWEFSEAMLEGAGGIDSFNSSMSDYMGNFFSEQEQYEMQLANLTTSFNTLDGVYKDISIVLPETNEGFRELLEGLDLTTLEGAKAYGEILGLSGSFAELTSASEDLLGATDEVASSIQAIADAWLGSLSYLTLEQKSIFADEYAKLALSGDSGLDVVETTRAAAEAALQTTSTKEEYIPIFNRYIQALEDDVVDATLDDVVNELVVISTKIQELEETQRRLT